MAQELKRLGAIKRIDAIDYLLTKAEKDFPNIQNVDRFFVSLVPEGNKQVWALMLDSE